MNASKHIKRDILKYMVQYSVYIDGINKSDELKAKA